MLSRVRDQRPSHNNSSWISSSVAVSRAKLLYYRLFAMLYGIVGGFASRVMVNSNWTRRHVASLWKRCSPAVVFPPCDTSELEVSRSGTRISFPHLVKEPTEADGHNVGIHRRVPTLLSVVSAVATSGNSVLYVA